MRKRNRSVIAALLSLLLLAVACGTEDDTSGEGEAGTGENAGDTEAEEGGDGEGGDSAAADFPSDTVEIIVSFAPGGGMDVTARTFAEHFSEHLGTEVVVTNIQGGGGVAGISEGMQAEPDGYTLTHVPPQVVQHQYFREESVPYNEDTWEPLYMVSAESHLVTVAPDGPAGDFESGAELIQYAVENPGELTMGVGGILSSQDVSRAILANETGAEFGTVYYDGGAPVVTALLGGDVDFGLLFYPEVEGQVEAGELEVIGSLGEEPPETLPDLPTLSEEGIDVTTSVWRGFVAPKGTPQEVVDILANAMQATVEDPDWIAAMEEAGIPISVEAPEAFQQLMEETARQAEAVSDIILEDAQEAEVEGG